MLIQHCSKINATDPDILKIKDWIQSFIYEMDFYSERSAEEPWRLYSERPMLGFLANGITRSDINRETVILQEFGVHNSGSYHGRCDLFLLHNNKAYLFEGKHRAGSGGDSHWNIDNHKTEMQRDLAQLEGYYYSEEKAYNHYS
jgi:hypothetical protein